MVSTAPAAASPRTYTVASGDTLASIAKEFGCSAHQLKHENHLTKTHLKLGQILKLPTLKVASLTHRHSKLTASERDPKSTLTHVRRAEPIQDFDLPASTFASCPTPPEQRNDPTSTTALVTPALLPLAASTESPSSRSGRGNENAHFTGHSLGWASFLWSYYGSASLDLCPIRARG